MIKNTEGKDMTAQQKRWQDEYAFIQDGLRKIESDNTEAKKFFYVEFYNKYNTRIHKQIEKFVFKIAHEKDDARTQDLKNDFIVKILTDTRKLSNYDGRASFPTYMYTVLRFFLIDSLTPEGEDLFDSGKKIKPSKLIEEDFLDAQDDFIDIIFCSGYKRSKPSPDNPLNPSKHYGKSDGLVERQEKILQAIQVTFAQALLQFSFYYPEDAYMLTLELFDYKRTEIAKRLDMIPNTLNQRFNRTVYNKFSTLFREILRKNHNINIEEIKVDLPEDLF